MLLRRRRGEVNRVKAQLLTQLERFATVLDDAREERSPLCLQRLDTNLRSVLRGQRLRAGRGGRTVPRWGIQPLRIGFHAALELNFVNPDLSRPRATKNVQY